MRIRRADAVEDGAELALASYFDWTVTLVNAVAVPILAFARLTQCVGLAILMEFQKRKSILELPSRAVGCHVTGDNMVLNHAREFRLPP
jgi:hypothetical protein